MKLVYGLVFVLSGLSINSVITTTVNCMNSSDDSNNLTTPLAKAVQGALEDQTEKELDIRELLINGADANKSINGPIPLWWAVFNHNIKVILLLRQYGANPDIDANTNHKQTTLQYAKKLLQDEQIKLNLIQAKNQKAEYLGLFASDEYSGPILDLKVKIFWYQEVVDALTRPITLVK